MSNLDEIKRILETHKIELNKKYKVSKIGVFGSYARGEQTEKSDLDLLVEFDGVVSLFEFVHLIDYVEGFLKTKVDMVTRPAIKPAIKDAILSEVKWVA